MRSATGVQQREPSMLQARGGDYNRSSCDIPPQLSVKTRGGGGGQGVDLGGSAGGYRGGISAGGGFPRWGGLRATHYYHMHTSWGVVCLGVGGYGGMYAIIALSRPCREEGHCGWQHPAPGAPCPRADVCS